MIAKTFGNLRPVIGMLHLKADMRMDHLERARQETMIYHDCGVDAVLVENYFGSIRDCEQVLAWLQQSRIPGLAYGVNILGDYYTAFKFARKYDASFIQIDSVCGHLPPRRDAAFAADLNALRKNSSVAVLGGVRFKYQPVNSGRTQTEDLQLGMERCDAIVVTGEGTGLATPLDKVREFRQVLGDFPLIVGAGCTLDTVRQTFALADGAIVGSYFKEGHRDSGDLDPGYVDAFMRRKRECCAAAGQNITR